MLIWFLLSFSDTVVVARYVFFFFFLNPLFCFPTDRLKTGGLKDAALWLNVPQIRTVVLYRLHFCSFNSVMRGGRGGGAAGGLHMWWWRWWYQLQSSVTRKRRELKKPLTASLCLPRDTSVVILKFELKSHHEKYGNTGRFM